MSPHQKVTDVISDSIFQIPYPRFQISDFRFLSPLSLHIPAKTNLFAAVHPKGICARTVHPKSFTSRFQMKSRFQILRGRIQILGKQILLGGRFQISRNFACRFQILKKADSDVGQISDFEKSCEQISPKSQPTEIYHHFSDFRF